MGKFANDNDHEFELTSDVMDSLILEDDPLNWDSDEKSFEYDKLGGGTLLKNNTSLEFTGDGFDFIRSHGFNANIGVIKRIKDPTKIGEDWRIAYQTGIDRTSAEFDRSRTKNVAKVGFTQGGLYDRIKARYSDTFDLVDTKDADGNDIGELTTIIEQSQGREIFRRSVGEVEDGVYVSHPVTGADKDVARAVLLSFKPNSDSDNINNITKGTEYVPFAGGNYVTGQVGSIILTRSDRYRERKINGKVKVTLDPDKLHLGYIRLDEIRYKYNNATNAYEYVSRNQLAEANTINPNGVIDYDFVDHSVILDTDEAWTLAFHSNTNDGIGYEYIDNQITITEDDSYPATEAKALLPFEFFERLLQKITGETGLLKSNLFGRTDLGYDTDGEWALLGTSSGYWGRGFDIGSPIINKETGEEEPKKQFSISLKDTFESFYTPIPLVWGIEKIKGKEYFRLEHYDYTQQDFVGVRMGRVINGNFVHIPAQKPIETPLPDNLFSSVEIGYQSGGSDYEEVAGLSSPHGIGKYTTSYNKQANTYTKSSKIRADLEGYDLARRKQSIYYPDTDTSYDQHLFFRHLKKVGTQYFLREWQDDFSEAPKNVYSPDTTGNLLLMPFYCLIRHGRIISTALTEEPYSKVVAISSGANNDKIITKLIGGDELAQNGFILNKDLGTPYYNGYLLKFDGKVYQSMIDEMEGFTDVDGEQIPNWFGKFEVMVDGYLQYGRLVKSTITGEGKHEIALI